MRQMWDWDGQYYTGAIPQVPHTYNVVGNSNEWGVIITETTFGGRGDLDGHNTGAEISYGDMIWTTLERSKTAREAIATMDALCSAYGYESNGESFGVGDATEVWLLELVGKGKHVPDAKGCVWVASKIPDGYVGSTANQARTETFVQNDPNNCGAGGPGNGGCGVRCAGPAAHIQVPTCTAGACSAAARCATVGCADRSSIPGTSPANTLG
jgi:dipeptidase